MARTAPVPNIPAIPGMNPGTWILGGDGGGGGGSGRGGRGRGGGQGANGSGDGEGAQGGGKNAGSCGPGSGGGCPNPSHGRGGGTSAGDPIDPVTGRVYTAKVVDLALPGPIPLFIERSYSSETRDVDLGLGFGWSHSLAWTIEERRRTLRVLEPNAAPTTAAVPEPGRPVALPCGRLTRHEAGYTLEAGGLLYVLGEQQESSWLLSRIVDRYGNEVRLAYEGKRLSHVFDSAGRVVRVRRHADGRVAAFEVKNASAQGRWTSFRTYRYGERGDLVAAIDAAGHEHRYEYDEEHRLIRRREPGGLVAQFRYDDRGRCVETWCERPGNDALDRELPDTLDDGETRAKGFCHVKIEDHGVFTEVITSRSKRRIEGNPLDKADKVVWQGGCTRTGSTPRATCSSTATPSGMRGAASATRSGGCAQWWIRWARRRTTPTTSWAASPRCGTRSEGSPATSGTRKGMSLRCPTSSGSWRRSATTNAACSSRRPSRTAA
ncbi:DUF6531 domain-containing protein [Sorangium sp. So ce363]|uniref:DUF6531 domain-containing protein n=1 Tax=Sorangium sp. So ce363 TaxID=3133304 RepID=UPI003F622F16